eukprot:c25967_g1_i1.p1 GENE.c25967_g1_i1~~c25967_g1_i1.p1  ORF type:complete len:314 (-),score=104.11 c25967_g1_i1:213-1118(-)
MGAGAINEPKPDNFWFAVGLTVLCSFATVLGGLLIFVLDLGASEKSPELRQQKYNFQLGASLSFACGVMIYISFQDMMVSAIQDIGFFEANLWMFVGAASFAVIARFIPEPDELLLRALVSQSDNNNKGGKNSNKHPSAQDKKAMNAKGKLYMTGLVAASAVSLHNLPEGLAVYLAALSGTHRMSLFLGIFLHNIPEGLAVAMPLYAATGNKLRSVWWATLSGLAEPLGALVMGSLMGPQLTTHTIQAILASVAGIMIYISFSELYPTALNHVSGQVACQMAFAGMVVVFAGVHMLHAAAE